MNQRLVWNFEIIPEVPLEIIANSSEEISTTRWEARFFWPHDAIIEIRGLTTKCLDLTQFKYKHRNDTYYLLPDHLCNVKQRDLTCVYKPLMDESLHCQSFEKKINLMEFPKNTLLPGIPPLKAATLLQLIEDEALSIPVEKVALIYRLSTMPAIKLELSRLTVFDNIYFSACIEGRSQRLVRSISQHLFAAYKQCSYIQFLKDTVRSFHA